jgi:hypothetical protein
MLFVGYMPGTMIPCMLDQQIYGWYNGSDMRYCLGICSIVMVRPAICLILIILYWSGSSGYPDTIGGQSINKVSSRIMVANPEICLVLMEP